MDAEEKVVSLKRVLRVLKRLSGELISGVDFTYDDMKALEEIITDYGGDARGAPHRIGLYQCNGCSKVTEYDDLHRCSLDAYAEAGDFDLFCPHCGDDDILPLN